MTTALALFELRRASQRRMAVLSLVVFAAALAIGHVDQWSGRGAPNGTAFFGYAYLAGAVLLLRYGLAADRRLRFDEYLIVNHVSRAAYLAAKVVAMAALLLGYGFVAGLLEAVYTGGGLAEAAWNAAAWTLIAWLVAPIAMLVEAFVDTAIPAAVVLLVYLIVVFTEFVAMKSLTSVEVLGVRNLAPDDWSSLGPLAARSLIGVPTAFLVVAALAALRLRRC